MKIGYDAKRIFNNSTGLGNYSRTLVRNLQHYYPQDEYLLFTPKINSQITCSYFKEHFKVIEAHRYPKSLWRSFGIKTDIYHEKINIFHGLSNEIPFGLKGVKTIVTIHDLIFKTLAHTYPLFDRFIYNKKIKYSCEKADLIIAISENTKNDIIQYFDVPPHKIKVLYQACNHVFYQENNHNPQLLIDKLDLPQDFILSVGTLEERKNLINVLKAVKQIPVNDRVPLYVVGKGKSYKKILQRFIDDNHLNKWVVFINEYINDQELRCLYELATLIVYPSLYEGFGLPVLEGLLSKTPVITSNISSLPEALGNKDFAINPYDVEELKSAIINTLQDNDLQNEMTSKGFDHAINNFHPKTLSQQ